MVHFPCLQESIHVCLYIWVISVLQVWVRHGVSFERLRRGWCRYLILYFLLLSVSWRCQYALLCFLPMWSGGGVGMRYCLSTGGVGTRSLFSPPVDLVVVSICAPLFSPSVGLVAVSCLWIAGPVLWVMLLSVLVSMCAPNRLPPGRLEYRDCCDNRLNIVLVV